MPIYRVLRPLSKKEKVIPRQTLTGLGWLNEEQIGRLEAVGAVSRIRTPPLAALPGCRLWSKKLEPHGILDGEAFLEGDNELLAVWLGTTQQKIRQLKSDVERWFVIPDEPRRG